MSTQNAAQINLWNLCEDQKGHLPNPVDSPSIHVCVSVVISFNISWLKLLVLISDLHSVSIVTKQRVEILGLYSGQKQGFIFWPPRPDRLWGPSSHLFSLFSETRQVERRAYSSTGRIFPLPFTCMFHAPPITYSYQHQVENTSFRRQVSNKNCVAFWRLITTETHPVPTWNNAL